MYLVDVHHEMDTVHPGVAMSITDFVIIDLLISSFGWQANHKVPLDRRQLFGNMSVMALIQSPAV